MASTSATQTDGLLLDSDMGPEAVKRLPAGALPLLAARIRAFLVEKVGAAGGHLWPNRGVVELSIALHRVFDSPWDTVLFDIAHQRYVHKLLTGRAGSVDNLRDAGGRPGYLSPAQPSH